VRRHVGTLLEDITRRYGRGSIGLGHAGIRGGPDWTMKRDMLSPRYTTHWDELPPRQSRLNHPRDRTTKEHRPMSTAIADTTPQTHDTLVRLDAAGKPLAVRYDGRIWLVDPDTESRHRFGRDAWWDARRTAAVGSGDLVSIEYWQVQVRFIYPRVGFTAMCVLN
jgi:hypothetical protein